jgi:hypothetical protein
MRKLFAFMVTTLDGYYEARTRSSTDPTSMTRSWTSPSTSSARSVSCCSVA